jgi:hypothetical protein
MSATQNEGKAKLDQYVLSILQKVMEMLPRQQPSILQMMLLGQKLHQHLVQQL